MKLNILTTSALLAIAATALTQSAKAQFVAPTPMNPAGSANNGDLILAFQDNTSSDNGSTTNYEVDLGNYSQYLTATSTINIVNIATDLDTLYSSSNPLTNPNITVALLGSYNNSTTNQGDLVGIPNPLAPNGPQTNSQEGSSNGVIANIYNPGTAASNLPTDGAATGSFLVPTVNSNSFYTVNYVEGVGLSDSASVTTGGAPDLTLEDIMHTATGNSSTHVGTDLESLGYFTVSSSGEVEYVVGLAPEPSTYALMCLGFAVLFWHLRRKSISSL